MKKVHVKVIRTESEHQQALMDIEALWDAEPGTADHALLEVLSMLVEDYERRTFPVDEPDAVVK